VKIRGKAGCVKGKSNHLSLYALGKKNLLTLDSVTDRENYDASIKGDE
jgi:hypothetical protein